MITNPLSNRELFSLMDAVLRPRSEELHRVPQLALPLDVYEKDGVLNVRAAMPGVAPENVEISMEDNVLTISGENHSSHEDKESKIYRRENVYGQFRRSVRLSEEFDAARANAQFKNGMVTVTIPRSETAKPKVFRIPVTSTVEESVSKTSHEAMTSEEQA